MADKNQPVHEAALGWLEIEISGEYTERLLNMALQQGIELRQIRRLGQHKLVARLLLAEVYDLRPLLTATRCRLRIIKRGGRPFWLFRAGKRLGLIAGSLLFALALYAMCSFVWVVDVRSIYDISAADRERVLLLAQAAGLQAGAWTPDLDMAAIDQYILAEASDLVFAYTEKQGVYALIHIVRRVDVAGGEKPLPPGDIVAAYDGLIEQILVRSGTAAVEPGATVKAGDVLVYGYGGGQPVAASALIEARVWGQAIGSWPLVEQGLQPSGRHTATFWLCFSAAENTQPVLLSGPKVSPYAQSTQKTQVYTALLWRNIPLPVEIILDAWYEQQPYATRYSRAEALSHAEQQAAGRALEQLPGNCDLQGRTAVELEGSSDDIVRVQVVCEARADIGEFMALDETRLRMYEQMLAQEQLKIND